MPSFVFFLLVLLNYTNASLSSVILLHSKIMAPERELPSLMEENGKLKVPEGLFPENSSQGFISSQAASTRALIWNSGKFRDYLETVVDSVSLFDYFSDFAMVVEKKCPNGFDREMMLLVLKDAVLLILAMEQGAKTSVKDSYIMMSVVIKMVVRLTKHCYASPNVSLPSFLVLKETPYMPELPFKGSAKRLGIEHRANYIGITSGIRLIYLCEKHLRDKFGCTHVAQFIVENSKEPWMLEEWLKPYIEKRMISVDGLCYLTAIPTGIAHIPNLAQLVKDDHRTVLVYNLLMSIDQITFQLDHVRNSNCIPRESTLLQYLDLANAAAGVHHYIREVLDIWKELLQVGLSSIINYQTDFASAVFVKIRIARIHFLLPQNKGKADKELKLLDRIEALFRNCNFQAAPPGQKRC